jgi:ERCC4-type nuclease
MTVDLSGVTISVTKPNRRPAALLAEMGITVRLIDQDEGNVDRYILSKRVAVERRTGGGFLMGIQDKTLFVSAIYLREHFRVPILIVEGGVDYEYSRFDPQAVRGAMSSMMLLYGVSVLSTANVDETAALLAMIARQEQIGIPEISLIPKRKATDLPDLQRRVVEMLPGCGMVMARQLLQHFGSLRRVVNADKDELLALRGIGATKAARMHKVFTAEYESVDTEQDLEDAIEADPSLLFDRPVELLARQHHIYTDHQKDRHVVDLAYLDRGADEIVLVELKRGELMPAHYGQIRRYLDNAEKSKLLRPHLARGASIRGVLATIVPGRWTPKLHDVSVRIVDERKVVEVLQRLRAERWADREAGR